MNSCYGRSLRKHAPAGRFLLAGAVLALPLNLSCSADTATRANAPTKADKSDFFFRDGDRAMILGDSITEQRMYSTLIESYVLSRFPNWKITFRNTGWGGDTADFQQRSDLDNGLARDILPLQPTAVTIDFGMNDARRGEAGYERYVESSRLLTQRLKAAGARVALVAPSAEERYEEGQPAGSAYNNLLRKYSQGLVQVARSENVWFVDQLNPMIANIEAGRMAGVLSTREGGTRFIPDGVHPGWAGHLLMATHILKGLKAPALVSRVEFKVDAKTTGRIGKAALVENADVTNITYGAGVGTTEKTAPRELTFTRLDKALPWPVSKDALAALAIPGFKPFDSLSRYDFQVQGLPAGNYELRIDDQPVGTWTAMELAGGINLTTAPGPIQDQQQKLLAAILRKNSLFYTRWRQVQFRSIPEGNDRNAALAQQKTELENLDNQIAAAEKEIDVLRQPIAHIWRVIPAAAKTP